MLTLHEDIELTVGDTWEILGQLLQEDGNPLNLVPAVDLGWILLGPDGMRVTNLAEHATLVRVDPVSGGQVLITVPEELTQTFRPGRYTNAIRVWVGGTPATLWRGMILAAADPFHD